MGRALALTLGLLASAVRAEAGFHLIDEPRDAGPPARLSGQVRAMGTRLPVPAAQLTVLDGGVSLETDGDGRFTVSLE
ncbi:MAG: hypothetical protein SFW67_30510, partial [Myxococcaceae bacterium]|nr:hypothetical protein [Myxococcaceae bacterium]